MASMVRLVDEQDASLRAFEGALHEHRRLADVGRNEVFGAGLDERAAVQDAFRCEETVHAPRHFRLAHAGLSGEAQVQRFQRLAPVGGQGVADLHEAPLLCLKAHQPLEGIGFRVFARARHEVADMHLFGTRVHEGHLRQGFQLFEVAHRGGGLVHHHVARVEDGR